MLQKLDIRGIHLEVDEALKKYISKKIGRLDKYMSRHDRQSARADVHLKETKTKDKKCSIIEVTLQLPNDKIVVKESTINMYAAVDIAEHKLKLQLQKHKEQHENGKTRRHLFGRFSRKIDRRRAESTSEA